MVGTVWWVIFCLKQATESERLWKSAIQAALFSVGECRYSISTEIYIIYTVSQFVFSRLLIQEIQYRYIKQTVSLLLGCEIYWEKNTNYCVLRYSMFVEMALVVIVVKFNILWIPFLWIIYIWSINLKYIFNHELWEKTIYFEYNRIVLYIGISNINRPHDEWFINIQSCISTTRMQKKNLSILPFCIQYNIHLILIFFSLYNSSSNWYRSAILLCIIQNLVSFQFIIGSFPFIVIAYNQSNIY